MKQTYNKSRLMKDAHRMRKYEGLEMSIAMKLAWINEKKKAIKEAEALAWSKPDTNFVAPRLEEISMSIADFNTSYYANNIYNGD